MSLETFLLAYIPVMTSQLHKLPGYREVVSYNNRSSWTVLSELLRHRRMLRAVPSCGQNLDRTPM